MKARRAPMGLAAAAAIVGGSLWVPPQQAKAQTLQPVVDVCTGISVDDSALRDILSTTVVPTASTVETIVDDLLGVTLPLVGTLILPSILGPVDLGVAETTDAIAAGNVVGLTVLDTDGAVVGPGDCNLTADGYTLNNEGGISIGGNQITGLGANGQAATAAEIDAIAFGNNASTAVGATGAVAIGANASATAADSVALGSDSLADRANTISVGTAGGERQIVNVADGTAATDAATVGQMNTSIAAAVADSVNYDGAARDTLTLAGAGGTRVTNVAAGTLDAASSDAVNGAQLFATNQNVATNATDIGTLDGRVTANEGDIATLDGRVTTNAGDITALDGRLTTSEGDITALDGRVSGTEARISVNEADIAALQDFTVAYDDAGRTGVTLAGAGGTTISNVAAGTLDATSSEAVNGAQLFATNQGVATNTSDIATLDGRVTLNADELDTVNGRLQLTEDELAALQGAAIVYDDVTQGTVTLNGAGGTVIANVAAGSVTATSTEAVNGAQLFATNQTVATNASDIAALDGRVTLNEGDLATINGRLQLSEEELAALRGSAVTYDDDTQGTVTLAGADGTVVTNVAAGSVAADSTDAVNGAQLFATNEAVTALDGRVAQNETDIATNTSDIADLQASIGDVEGTFAEVDGRITRNETDIATLDGRVTVNEADIATLDGRVTTNEADIAAIDGRVAVNETNIAAIDDRVTVNETNITQIDGRVATNEANIADLDGRIAAHEGGMAAVNDQIVILAENVSGLDTRVTVNEGNIANMDTRVALAETNITAIQAQVDNVPVGYVSDADGTTPSATATNTAAFAGATAGPVRVTNVADATLAAGSSDAATGGQLYETNLAVNRNTADIQTINNNLAGSTVVAVQYSNPGNPTASNGGTITNDVTLVGADAAAPVALHNVAAGTAPTDAVNVQQLQTGMTNTLASAMTYTDARFQQVGFDLAELRDDAFSGTAAAMAMTAIPQTMDAGSTVFGGAVGHYRGKTAFGFGLSSAFADGQAVLKVSGTIDTQGKGGVAAGAGFAF